MFTQDDYKQLEQKGITVSQVVEQLQFFEQGFPALKIKASASTDKGIMVVSQTEEENYLREWNNFLKQNPKIVKFVPASGAASRMFKDLYEFLESPSDTPTTPYMQKFFSSMEDFAFYEILDEICRRNDTHQNREIVENLLTERGLNYGHLPKGLILFHKYPDFPRTAFEEHLAEGALYASGADRVARLHFTVSQEHLPLFEAITRQVKPHYSKLYETDFDISFSLQKPSTDTVAVDKNNTPLRENGKLLFRPGGHGALIENLNDIDADIVFIKNIDNVVPDSIKSPTIRYKKIIAGILAKLRNRSFEYLRLLDSGHYTNSQLLEMIHFLQDVLCIKNPETKFLEDVELAIYLRSKLNRPMRVCGMVRNESEPGGGPFLAYNSDDTVSPQILESSQIDLNNPETKAVFEQSTHFNPVDLVCSLKNYKGEKFDLRQYIDRNTGFISEKSKNGRTLRALELPGLWNGAMSDWNTVFVEVPISTFNPVKTVNDLLKSGHNLR